MLKSIENSSIAIIGMGCRLPGHVNSPDDFWELLKKGQDAIVDIPDERWNKQAYFSQERGMAGKMITKQGGFIDHMDQFDAGFFKFSSLEATYLDPQQRKLLETTYEALEDAGLTPSDYVKKNVGVYIGSFTVDYKILQFNDVYEVGTYTATGVMSNMLSNRLSHFYDFRGPSMSIDTACSSSLSAVHAACESLRNKESSMAVAGGSLLMITPEYHVAESKTSFLSKNARCRSFDKNADGYVRSEGVGVVILKRLEDAIMANDPIKAVIIGSAVNQDGATPSITTPNGEAQMEVIRKACNMAGISPEVIQYVEAHGTGTAIGDPIEAHSIGTVYRKEQNSSNKLYIGSCKSNIGHCESTAGIAGLIKTVLCLQHRSIPANIHFENPNPNIDFNDLRLEVPIELIPWPKNEDLLFAGINSFGFGGSNAHLVLKNYSQKPKVNRKTTNQFPFILPLSAQSKEALHELHIRYKEYIESLPEINNQLLSNICYSAGKKRAHYAYRNTVVFDTADQLLKSLKQVNFHKSKKGKLAWVFTGVGENYYGAGIMLMSKEKVFKDMMIKCDQVYKKVAGTSILETLRSYKYGQHLHEPWLNHPVHFSIQVSLAKLWNHWGIKPDSIIGHSAGEFAAFYVAGVYSLLDSMTLLYDRCDQLKIINGSGKMIVVSLSVERAKEILDDQFIHLEIASINSPQSVTISGPSVEIDLLVLTLQNRAVNHKILSGNIAYHHSSILNKLTGYKFLEFSVSVQEASIPLFSTTTGEWINSQHLPADYWLKNLVQPVRFSKAIQHIINTSTNQFLEIGSHPVLSKPVMESSTDKDLRIYPSLIKNKEERHTLLESLSKLYLSGFEVKWGELYPAASYVPIPTYPWQYQSYWKEPGNSIQKREKIQAAPLLGERMIGPISSWQAEITTEKFPYLKEHQVYGKALFPGAGYVEMIYSAAQQTFPSTQTCIEDIIFIEALPIGRKAAFRTQVHFEKETGQCIVLANESLTQTNFKKIATGHVRFVPPGISANWEHMTFVSDRCQNGFIEKKELYQEMKNMKFGYGPNFQGINKAWLGENESLCEIDFSHLLNDRDNYGIHPVKLDICFQTFLTLNINQKGRSFHIPKNIKHIKFIGPFTNKIFVHVIQKQLDANGLEGDLFVFDINGVPIMEVIGFCTQNIKKSKPPIPNQKIPSFLFKTAWQEKDNLSIQASQQKSLSEHRLWIIFADQNGFGQSISDQLKSHGFECLLFYYESKPDRSNEASFIWNENRFEVVLSLFPNYQVAGFLHLWSLDLDDCSQDLASKYYRAISNTIIYSAKKLMQEYLEGKLWLVTRNSQSVTQNDELNQPLSQMAWGLGRTIGHREMAEYWGGLVDLDQSNGKNDTLLLQELLHSDSEDQIAFRNNQRYVLRLLSEDNEYMEPSPIRFRSDGYYLITGAFGGIGKTVARWMASLGARRFIFTSSKKVPKRDEWNQLSSESDFHKNMQFVKELELKGASIYVDQVDLSDRESIKVFHNGFKKNIQAPIYGLVYCAGLSNDQIVQEIQFEKFNRVVDTKVIGSWVLHELLADEPLEHFVLFSSIASYLNNRGMSAYATANSFLDALANYRRDRGLSGLSINWGPWEIGMVEKYPQLVNLFNSMGLHCLNEAHGIQLLEHVFNQNQNQVSIMQIDKHKLMNTALQDIPFYQLIKEEVALDQTMTDETKKKKIPVNEHNNGSVHDHVINILAELMEVNGNDILVEESFVNNGIDSLNAIVFTMSIYEAFKVTVQIDDLLEDDTTVLELIDKIHFKLASVW